MDKDCKTRENRWRPSFNLETIRVSWLVLVVSGLLAVAIMVTFNFLISTIARNALTRFSEDSTIALANHLSDKLPREFHALYMKGDLDHRSNETQRQAALQRVIAGHVHAFDVVKVKIFDRERRIVFSTDSEMQGTRIEHNPGYEKALTGMASSHLEIGAEVQDFTWETEVAKDVIETYVPLWAPPPKTLRELTQKEPDRIIGVFEIYRDAAFLIEVLDSLKRTFLWTSSAALGLLLAAFSSIAVIALKKRSAAEKLFTIDEVAVGIKHHLNNSLTGILNVMGMLLQPDPQRPPLDDETREALEKCEEEARRMQDVVKKLSQMSTPVVTEYLKDINMIDFDESR